MGLTLTGFRVIAPGAGNTNTYINVPTITAMSGYLSAHAPRDPNVSHLLTYIQTHARGASLREVLLSAIRYYELPRDSTLCADVLRQVVDWYFYERAKKPTPDEFWSTRYRLETLDEYDVIEPSENP